MNEPSIDQLRERVKRTAWSTIDAAIETLIDNANEDPFLILTKCIIIIRDKKEGEE
jgi:hypothetical protein